MIWLAHTAHASEDTHTEVDTAGGASPVPLSFSLPLLLPAIAVVAYILGRLYAPHPQIVPQEDPDGEPPP